MSEHFTQEATDESAGISSGMTVHSRPVLMDWRGNTYTVGSEVVYPRASGHSIEMSDGVVTAVYQSYRNQATNFHWKRVTEDTEKADRDSAVWRVQVKPHGLGSRGFWRGDWSNRNKVWSGQQLADIKLVTILNIKNITVIGPITDGVL